MPRLVIRIFVFLLATSFLLAEDDDPSEIFDFKTSKTYDLDERQNYFLTSTDFSIAPRVNPVTGEYCEQKSISYLVMTIL